MELFVTAELEDHLSLLDVESCFLTFLKNMDEQEQIQKRTEREIVTARFVDNYWLLFLELIVKYLPACSPLKTDASFIFNKQQG